MRLLAINQFYAPDHSATSQLLTELCEDLVAAGDRVTVIASRGTYLGGTKLPARETIRGVDVVRAAATSLGKASVAHRLADYGTFGTSAMLELARAARPDLILALTTPPMIASAAAIVARARGVPLVTWVQDLYPEVAVAFGVLRAGSIVSLALARIARLTQRAACLSVALSDGMAARLAAQGQAPARVRVVSNWSDGQRIYPVPQEANAFRRAHGLEGRFVVGYSGNFGLGHDLASLIDAARRLEKSLPELLVLLVGDGARRGEIERLARGLDNVRVLPYQPRESLHESLSAADIHVATLAADLEGLLVPSKLYGILAAGRPLIYAGPEACEVARVVREHDLGFVVPPGDAEALAHAICRAARAVETTREMGARSRRVFDRHFDRPHAVARFRSVLREAVAGCAA
ncbi:MAG: glycosyltransferase WbuB [Myxococcales bacterium]|nr:glycosyltransferase WbuB [Myxococcales bacterium]